jgi:hypothetical protein
MVLEVCTNGRPPQESGATDTAIHSRDEPSPAFPIVLTKGQLYRQNHCREIVMADGVYADCRARHGCVSDDGDPVDPRQREPGQYGNRRRSGPNCGCNRGATSDGARRVVVEGPVGRCSWGKHSSPISCCGRSVGRGDDGPMAARGTKASNCHARAGCGPVAMGSRRPHNSAYGCDGASRARNWPAASSRPCRARRFARFRSSYTAA